MKYLITLIFVFLLAACDSKIGVSNSSIEGTYTSTDGKDSYVFTSNGEVQTDNFGKLKKTSYTLKEGAIHWQFVGGMPTVFKKNDDGSLTSRYGRKYIKK